MKTDNEIDKWEDPRDAMELFWASHYTYLLGNGYQLRARYRPGWVPSWLGASERPLYTFEDRHSPVRKTNVIDAIRTEDGFAVALKRVPVATQELSTLRCLSWDPETQSPLNHTAPLLHVLPVPGDPEVSIAVMPKLRDFLWPTFHCRREVLECLRQIIEGVGFMHGLNICHGDACTFNFMMDATDVCPGGFHFAFPESINGTDFDLVTKPRCQCQVRYYIIDFETSQQFSGDRDDALRQVYDTRCQIRTAPELSEENVISEVPYNPFRLDIYNIGATFESICDNYFEQLDDLRPFLGRLTAKEPSERARLEDAMIDLLAFIASRSEEWLDFPIKYMHVSLVTAGRYSDASSLVKLHEDYRNNL
ncbi:hypothetical protein BDZ89DRAFT_994015 [Hymenopellis radicata]|nr:hypothetical protein BDZ89DRAFT_994015 [Hymenopellis radicata]